MDNKPLEKADIDTLCETPEEKKSTQVCPEILLLLQINCQLTVFKISQNNTYSFDKGTKCRCNVLIIYSCAKFFDI